MYVTPYMYMTVPTSLDKKSSFYVHTYVRQCAHLLRQVHFYEYETGNEIGGVCTWADLCTWYWHELHRSTAPLYAASASCHYKSNEI